MLTETDNMGNFLKIDDSGKISLKLVNERKTRYIGQLFERDGYNVYAKTEEIKDGILRINNSWGLCYPVLQKLDNNGYVEIYDDQHRVFRQTKKYIIEHGTFLHFKKQGFEKRIFLPLEEWFQESY